MCKFSIAFTKIHLIVIYIQKELFEIVIFHNITTFTVFQINAALLNIPKLLTGSENSN